MNIILIGYMGSGKTTIGQALAERLSLKFIDTDKVIEKQSNISIAKIFEIHGESYFRLLEKKAIEELKDKDGYVIAVGGGAVMFHDNFDTLKKIGVTVFLNAPLHKILNNLKGKFRPLVGNTIDENKVKELLEYRLPTYQNADIAINTDNLDIKQTIDEIVVKLDQ